jgi:hypothetical protein
VAKATKTTRAARTARAPKRMAQHTWKVTRRNDQVEITADDLTVVYGDLVFSTRGVVVRVIGVDAFSDVELISLLEL